MAEETTSLLWNSSLAVGCLLVHVLSPNFGIVDVHFVLAPAGISNVHWV